jgi:ankyrin repeat protein
MPQPLRVLGGVLKAQNVDGNCAHEKVVKVLLDSGEKKQVKDNDGKTVLHIAARYGHENVVKVLLDSGAEKEARQVDDWTALHVAA